MADLRPTSGPELMARLHPVRNLDAAYSAHNAASALVSMYGGIVATMKDEIEELRTQRLALIEHNRALRVEADGLRRANESLELTLKLNFPQAAPSTTDDRPDPERPPSPE
jgi:hypothetical protein